MKRNVKTYIQFLNEDLLKGGAADNMTEFDFDPIELELGIKDEMEHTNNKELAKEIAMDHLAKDPHYYSKHKDINEKIKHEGDRWNVYSKNGRKLLGSHETRKEARKQLAAIEIAKHK